MKYRNPTIALMLGGVVFLFSAECFAQSHCRRDEMDYFSCVIKGSRKVVSLCGNKLKHIYETGGLEGSIQYRFGIPGQPELIYPKKVAGSVAKFKGVWTKGYRISYDELSFQNQGVRYSLVSGQNDQPNESESFVGVEVKHGTTTTRFSCDKWLTPRTNYSIDNDFPNDFHDLVRQLDTAAD
jgi:hypothetical protein